MSTSLGQIEPEDKPGYMDCAECGEVLCQYGNRLKPSFKNPGSIKNYCATCYFQRYVCRQCKWEFNKPAHMSTAEGYWCKSCWEKTDPNREEKQDRPVFDKEAYAKQLQDVLKNKKLDKDQEEALRLSLLIDRADPGEISRLQSASEVTVLPDKTDGLYDADSEEEEEKKVQYVKYSMPPLPQLPIIPGIPGLSAQLSSLKMEEPTVTITMSELKKVEDRILNRINRLDDAVTNVSNVQLQYNREFEKLLEVIESMAAQVQIIKNKQVKYSF